jgi:acetolactate synthase-1/2/3 large subunit
MDYCKVAEGLGCDAIRITKPEEVAPDVAKALACKRPVLVDVVIDRDDKVFPMVSPGASIEKAFDARDLEAQEK